MGEPTAGWRGVALTRRVEATTKASGADKRDRRECDLSLHSAMILHSLSKNADLFEQTIRPLSKKVDP